MTEITHTTNVSEATMRAELAALPDGFDWILPDCGPIDCNHILADTHREYAPDIEALRAKIAGDRPADDVSFLMLDDEPCAYVNLHTETRRTAA